MNYFQTYYLLYTGDPLTSVILDIFQLKEYYRMFGEQISERICVIHRNNTQKGIFSAN
jgi:hypothetical protein